jgi:hypothetical protein
MACIGIEPFPTVRLMWIAIRACMYDDSRNLGNEDGKWRWWSRTTGSILYTCQEVVGTGFEGLWIVLVVSRPGERHSGYC